MCEVRGKAKIRLTFSAESRSANLLSSIFAVSIDLSRSVVESDYLHTSLYFRICMLRLSGTRRFPLYSVGNTIERYSI